MASHDEEGEFEETRTRINAMSTEVLTGPLPAFRSAQLEVLAGPDAGAKYPLVSMPVILGRGQFADIRLRDHGLSRLHAIVNYADSEFRIMDNASSNGTFLNGSRVKEYRLRSGDKLLVGATLLLFTCS